MCSTLPQVLRIASILYIAYYVTPILHAESTEMQCVMYSYMHVCIILYNKQLSVYVNVQISTTLANKDKNFPRAFNTVL